MNNKQSEWDGLDKVEKKVYRRYSSETPLHRIFLLPQNHCNLGIYIFYHTEEDVKICYETGISDKILDAIHEELEKINRGPTSNVSFTHVFGSDEDVQKNFKGNYYLRLL
ncbi:MAG: hypothetical protein JW725_00885 [Candidatus Babeliaceae bacterium]|nr:hypothetical protein [Candidatus Babeliaceae bacterium]